jgi:hypothetical protein
MMIEDFPWDKNREDRIMVEEPSFDKLNILKVNSFFKDLISYVSLQNKEKEKCVLISQF